MHGDFPQMGGGSMLGFYLYVTDTLAYYIYICIYLEHGMSYLGYAFGGYYIENDTDGIQTLRLYIVARTIRRIYKRSFFLPEYYG